jgi:cysteine-rich repeat protein
MQMILAVAVVVALLALPGAAHAQEGPEPEFIGFANPLGSDPPCDISPQSASDSETRPVFPILNVPVNGSVELHLCYLVWPQKTTSDGMTMCDAGDGTESCAEQISYVTNGGIEIQTFQPIVPTEGEDFPAYETRLSGQSLMTMGGHPVSGRLGSESEGVYLGRVTLQGVAAGAYFELSSGSYVDAKGARAGIPNIVLATTADTCGDGTLDVGEECDDSNQDWGDGCSPTCKFESQLGLQGSAGTTGSVALEVDGTPVIVDLSGLPGAPAQTVIQALVTQVNNAAPITARAAQADDYTNETPNDGRLLATDGDFTAPPSVNDPEGMLEITVPEPGAFPMLVAGAAFLVAVGRRRMRC